MEEWITTAEAANILKVSRRRVTEMARQGKLKAKRDGKNWLVHSSLEQLDGVDKEVKVIPQGVSEEDYEILKEEFKILKEQLQLKEKELNEKSQKIGKYEIQLEEERKDFEEQVSFLKDQMKNKDKQIDNLQEELNQSRERADTIILQLTRQVEQAQKLASFYQQPFWRRWGKNKQLPEGRKIED